MDQNENSSSLFSTPECEGTKSVPVTPEIIDISNDDPKIDTACGTRYKFHGFKEYSQLNTKYSDSTGETNIYTNTISYYGIVEYL